MTDFLNFLPTVVVLVALFTALVGRLWIHKASLRNTWHFLFTAILLVVVSITNSNDTFFIVAFYILAISLTYELLLLLQALLKSLAESKGHLENSDSLNKSLKKMSMLLSSDLSDNIEQLQEVSKEIIRFETNRSEERVQFIQEQLTQSNTELKIHSSLNKTVVDLLLSALTMAHTNRDVDPQFKNLFDLFHYSLMDINASLIIGNGQRFNHLQHDRIDFVPCTHQEQANFIADTLKPGLIYQGQVIQRAMVSVFQYTPPKPEPVPNAAPETSKDVDHADVKSPEGSTMHTGEEMSLHTEDNEENTSSGTETAEMPEESTLLPEDLNTEVKSESVQSSDDTQDEEAK